MATQWEQRANGLESGVEWADWSRSSEVSLDPYLIWADITSFAGFSSGADPQEAARYRHDRWPLLVELSRRGLKALGEAADVPCVFGVMRIPGLYTVRQTDGSLLIPWSFVTARVDPRDLPHLLASKDIKRFQLGLPRIGDTGAQADVRGGLVSGRRPRVVVGVIDDGCPVAHPMLLARDGSTRVRYLWDQDDRRQSDTGADRYWRRSADTGYGAEADEAALQRAVAAAARGAELEPYRRLRYGRVRFDDTRSSMDLTRDGHPLHEEMLAAGAHGGGVVALAAGIPSPLATQLAPQGQPRPVDLEALATRFFDPALDRLGPEARRDLLAQADQATQECDVVFVQLPTRCVLDTSGGALGVHVLDGIQYILDRAQRLAYPDEPAPTTERKFFDNRIVVNISYGSIAGGHDGTSMIELAIRELVRLGDNGSSRLWVVLAAGNAHRSRTQASLELQPGDTKSFAWHVGPDSPHAAFLEVWFPHEDVEGRALPPQTVDAFSLSVHGPGMPVLPRLRVGEIWQLCASGRAGPSAAAIFVRSSALSRRGTLLLLAVAPTRRGGSASEWRGEHGSWLVEVGFGAGGVATAAPRVRVHAWTERDDLLYAQGRPQQTRIESDDPVPEVTEFASDSLKVIRRGATLRRNEPLPHPLRPAYSLGSLAGMPTARSEFPSVGRSPPGRPGPEDEEVRLGTVNVGEVVVVGARRLLDGEMSPDSSGGPARNLSGVSERVAWFGGPGANDALRAPLTRRVSPDADAPGDLSPAVRGVRVPGLRPSSSFRLSGTSAAAASITRAIAQVQALARDMRDHDSTRAAEAEGRMARLLFEDFPTAPEMVREDTHTARSTPTPRKDDAFRRGRRRLR